jgi:hypothetical protein
MKFLAIILSVYTLLLSASVNCADCCASDDWCADERQTTEGVPHDCGGACSPFSACSSCVGFTLCCCDYSPVNLPAFVCLIAPYPQNIYSSPLINSIWQPPRVA